MTLREQYAQIAGPQWDVYGRYRRFKGYAEWLEGRIAELEDALANKAAEKMPHSFVRMKWACGHEGSAVCEVCFKEKCVSIVELKSAIKVALNEHEATRPLLVRIEELKNRIAELEKENVNLRWQLAGSPGQPKEEQKL